MINPINLLLLGLALQGQAQGAPDFVIGPDDTVTVAVVGMPQFSGDFLVPPNGYVTFPIVGVLKVQGMTLGGLTQILTEGFKKRLKNPEITVNLKTLHIDHVSVIGDLKTPGVFPTKPGTRILDVLSAAGGLLPGAIPSDYVVNLIRGLDKLSIPLPQVLTGDAAYNLPVKANDTVSLTSALLVPVNVVGFVKLPGLYRLRADLNGPLEALAAAGGTLDGAALTSIRIRRLNGQEFTVDLQPSLTKGGVSTPLPKLEYGDLIIVPQSTARFAVLGSVEVPGVYPMPEGHPTTLVDAVATAKGSDAKGSRFRYVGIVRTEGGKTTRLVFDLGKFLKKGDASQNPEIRSGDIIYVPQSVGINSSDLFRELAEVAAVAAIAIKG